MSFLSSVKILKVKWGELKLRISATSGEHGTGRIRIIELASWSTVTEEQIGGGARWALSGQGPCAPVGARPSGLQRNARDSRRLSRTRPRRSSHRRARAAKERARGGGRSYPSSGGEFTAPFGRRLRLQPRGGTPCGSPGSPRGRWVLG